MAACEPDHPWIYSACRKDVTADAKGFARGTRKEPPSGRGIGPALIDIAPDSPRRTLKDEGPASDRPEGFGDRGRAGAGIVGITKPRSDGFGRGFVVPGENCGYPSPRIASPSIQSAVKVKARTMYLPEILFERIMVQAHRKARTISEYVTAILERQVPDYRTSRADAGRDDDAA